MSDWELGIAFCALTRWDEDNGTWHGVSLTAVDPNDQEHEEGMDKDGYLHTVIIMPNPFAGREGLNG